MQLDFFPSRTITLYLARLFAVRIVAMLAILVLVASVLAAVLRDASLPLALPVVVLASMLPVQACTLLPFALSLVALRRLSAFQAQLAVNLEPVYAIALAILLLDEQRELTPTFYGGVAIVLVAVFARPLWQARVRATA